MKGCARSCVLLLVGWAAIAYGFYRYFITIHDFREPMYWASAVAGLFVIIVISYLLGIQKAYSERRMLFDAMAGTPPADGQWAAISGTIQATSPLTAPISGQRAVAYEYKISRDERVGKGTSEVVYYEGTAVAPSTISTRQGSVRLLSVPTFHEIDAESIAQSEGLRRAAEYVGKTEFTTEQTSKDRRKQLEAEWNDDDGSFRKDRRKAGDVDLRDGFRFVEKHIKQGEQICAFGLYSRERGGLIPHANWAKQTRVMRGDATKVAEQLRSRMVKYFIGAVIFSALVYGIVWLYQFQAAKLTP